VLELQWRW